MTAPVDIVNRALSLIGTQSTITSLEEASPEAVQGSLWYNSLRQRLLRTAPWGFARGQVALTQLGDLVPDQTSPYPSLWKYAYPSDCIKMRYVLASPPPDAFPTVQTGQPIPALAWLRPRRDWRFMPASDVDVMGNQSKVLLTNVYQAIGVYTRDITVPDLFDALFTDALENALAYRLVIALTGNAGMRAEFARAAEAAITAARVADGNEAIPSTDHSVDWIQTRGIGSAYGYSGLGSAGGQNLSGSWGDWYSGNDSWSM